ncbi:MAG: hypothetical protein ACRENE_01000 [Polyangiaceae bacterium]
MQHVDREEIHAANTRDGAKALKRAVDAARDAIRQTPGIAGKDAVREVCKMARRLICAAIDQLIADGEVVQRKGPTNRSVRLFLARDAPPE